MSLIFSPGTQIQGIYIPGKHLNTESHLPPKYADSVV